MKEGRNVHLISLILNFPLHHLSIQDLRDRYARVEIRASTPLVVFRESVAFNSASPEHADRPPQLSLPPWSEEEGTRGGEVEIWRGLNVSPTC